MPNPNQTKNLTKACRVAERLPADACPIERNEVLKDDELHLRNLDCPHYGNCVTMAAYLAWECFICTECPYRHTIAPDNRYLTGQSTVSNFFPLSKTREQGDDR